jgi:stress-induced-phosphoprotein 1
MGKNSKDYEPAIEAFNKALTEHRNQDTLKELNDAERAKKDLEQQKYYNPSLADEEREKGEVQFLQRAFKAFVKVFLAGVLLINLCVKFMVNNFGPNCGLLCILG